MINIKAMHAPIDGCISEMETDPARNEQAEPIKNPSGFD